MVESTEITNSRIPQNNGKLANAQGQKSKIRITSLRIPQNRDYYDFYKLVIFNEIRTFVNFSWTGRKNQ